MKRRWVGGSTVALLLATVGSATAATQSTVARPAEPLRMPVRGGAVVVKVGDYEAARRQVIDAAIGQGAELLQSRTDVNDKGRKHGWMRLRLPADRLPQLVPAIRAAGRLYAENLTTSDLASEYEELERRVGRLRQHETRLSGVLQSSRRLRGSDLLYIQERLFRAGVDEEMLQQRRVDLERAARASTLTVQLFEPGAEPTRPAPPNLGKRFAGSFSLARGAFTHMVARWLTLGAYLIVFAPVWLPVLLAAALVGRWLWRRGVLAYWTALLVARWNHRSFLSPPTSGAGG